MINAESLLQNDNGFQFASTHFISSQETYVDDYLSIKAVINFKKPSDSPKIISIGIHINKEYILEINNTLIAVKACSEKMAFKTLWSTPHNFQDGDIINLVATRGKDKALKNKISFECFIENGLKQVIDYTVFCKKPIQYGLYGTEGASFQSIQLRKKQPTDYQLYGQVDVINNGFEIQNGQVKYEKELEAGVYVFSYAYTILPQFSLHINGEMQEFFADNIYHNTFVLNNAEKITIEISSETPTTVYNFFLIKLSSNPSDIPLTPLVINKTDSDENIQYTVSDINLDNGVAVGFDVTCCDHDFYGSQTILQIEESLQINFVNNPPQGELSFYGKDTYYEEEGEGNQKIATYGDGDLRYFSFRTQNNVGLIRTTKVNVDPSNPIFKSNWINKILFDAQYNAINISTTSTAFLRLQTPVESENLWLYPISRKELDDIGIPMQGAMWVNDIEVKYELVQQNSQTMFVSTQEKLHGDYALFKNRVISRSYVAVIETSASKQENVVLFPNPIASYLIDNIIILNNESNMLDYQNFDPAATYYKYYTTFEDVKPFNRVSLHLSDLNPLYPIECSEDGANQYQQVFSTLDDNLVQQKIIEYSQDKVAIGDWYNISVLNNKQEAVSYVRYDNDYIYLTNHDLALGDKFTIRYVADKTFATNTKNGKTYLTIVNPTLGLSIKYTSSLKEDDYVHHINLNPFASDANSGFIYLTEQNDVRQLDIRFNKNIIKLDDEDLVIVTVKCLGDNNSIANNFNIECQCNHPSLVFSKYSSDEEDNIARLFNQAFTEYGEEYAKNLYNLLISDKYQSGQEIFLVQGRSTTNAISKEADLVFTDTITGIKSTLKLQVVNG